jgi:2-polyprenyl-3-methyl-5-hydroxy-6-metoxy-1,4-benzoquinol methylase
MDLRELNAREEQVINRHPWELARLEVANDIFKQQSLSNIEGFLDLGCGDSFFINSFYQLNPLNVPFFGVDINFEPPLLEKLNQENPAIKFFKTLDDLKDNYQGKISVVFLMDVIEHIENDIDFLKMVCQYPFITKDTIFIISVPAFQSLFASHDVFLGHYRRYDNTMLKSHIEQAGMQTLKVGYFFTSLLLPRWIQKTKESIKPVKETTGLVEWNGSAFKTRLITSILLLDYKFMRLLLKLGIKMPGLSNFAVCKPLAS